MRYPRPCDGCRITPRLAGRFNRLGSFVDVPPRIVELAEFGACSRHMGNVPWNKHDRAARLPGSNARGDHGYRIGRFAGQRLYAAPVHHAACPCRKLIRLASEAESRNASGL